MKSRTVQELLDWEPPNIQEIISHGVLHPGSRAVIFGRWGSWKSMLTMHLGFCLTQGLPWVGFQTTQCGVFVAQVEIPEAKYRERVQKYILHSHHIPSNMTILSEPFLRLTHSKPFKEFSEQVLRSGSQVMILDPFYRLYSGDINDNYQIQVLLDKLDELALREGLTMVIVGHTKKLQLLDPGQTRDWGQELIGGSYVMDWVDTAIAMEPVSDTDIHMHFVKVRHAVDEIGMVKIRVDRSNLHFHRLV